LRTEETNYKEVKLKYKASLRAAVALATTTSVVADRTLKTSETISTAQTSQVTASLEVRSLYEKGNESKTVSEFFDPVSGTTTTNTSFERKTESVEQIFSIRLISEFKKTNTRIEERVLTLRKEIIAKAYEDADSYECRRNIMFVKDQLRGKSGAGLLEPEIKWPLPSAYGLHDCVYACPKFCRDMAPGHRCKLGGCTFPCPQMATLPAEVLLDYSMKQREWDFRQIRQEKSGMSEMSLLNDWEFQLVKPSGEAVGMKFPERLVHFAARGNKIAIELIRLRNSGKDSEFRFLDEFVNSSRLSIFTNRDDVSLGQMMELAETSGRVTSSTVSFPLNLLSTEQNEELLVNLRDVECVMNSLALSVIEELKENFPNDQLLKVLIRNANILWLKSGPLTSERKNGRLVAKNNPMGEILDAIDHNWKNLKGSKKVEKRLTTLSVFNWLTGLMGDAHASRQSFLL